MNDPKTPRDFSPEEATSIWTSLRRNAPERVSIATRDDGEGRISHEELLETAREIGVTRSQMEAAIATEEQRRAERLAAAAAERPTRDLRPLVAHAIAYVAGNAILFVIDRRLSGGTWFYWALLAWGVALGVHAARALRPRPVPVREATTLSGARPPEISGGRLRQTEETSRARRRAGS